MEWDTRGDGGGFGMHCTYVEKKWMEWEWGITMLAREESKRLSIDRAARTAAALCLADCNRRSKRFVCGW
jgi:hypothetical protein